MTRFKTQEELEQERLDEQRNRPGAQVALPIDKLLVGYGRQSTVKQIVNNKESAQQQAIDMVNYGLELGWPDNLRLLFIENQLADGTVRKASGRLRIDQRPGLQEVVRFIQTGTVGAVLVRAIDRLFRDEEMYGPVAFMHICKEHHVIILTLDGDIYDFNNPTRDDDNRFIFEAKKAKDYIKHHVKGVMLRNRERKALRGEFSGHGIPTGLMLDDERKHYIANPLWAPVMADLVRRYKELDGSFAQLRREVAGMPIFPELPADILESTGPIYLRKVEGGYTVNTWSGLRNMLTNVALIGHTAYNGRLIKNTHAAIVDEADFWYAFNRLSKIDIDGNPTEYKATMRYSKGKREPHTALLDGIRANGQAVLTSPQGSVNVYRRTIHSAGAAYAIRNNRNSLDPFVTSIRVSDLDAVMVQRLIEQLSDAGELHYDLIGFAQAYEYNDNYSDTITGEVIQVEVTPQPNPINPELSTCSQLQALLQTPSTSLVGVNESIEQARKEHARLTRDYEVNFDLMTDKELRENSVARVKLAKDIAEMEKKREDARATVQDILAIERLLHGGAKAWYELPLERQRRFIRLVTKAVVLEELEGDWLKLTVKWTPYPTFSFTDIALIYRQNAGKTWTKQEDMLLLRWYGKARRAYLLEKLPNRTWQAIASHANNIKLKRHTYEKGTELPSWLSLTDKPILDKYGLTLEQPTSLCCWWLATPNVWEKAILNRDGEC